MDSRKEWGDGDNDYVIKQLVVAAEQNEIDNWELVAFVEVEVVEIEDGEDVGEMEFPVEVYRMPFPMDFRTRVALLREIQRNPKFFAA